MMRTAKWIAAAAVLFLVVAQLVPIDRTNPAVESEVPAPADVRAILRRACYDCHSNETVWPWYSRIAPASWLLAHDVHEGRAALNYSTWNRLDAKQQGKAVRETWEEVAEGEMPPWIYLPAHPEARLSADERAVLKAWSRSASPAPQGAQGG